MVTSDDMINFFIGIGVFVLILYIIFAVVPKILRIFF